MPKFRNFRYQPTKSHQLTKTQTLRHQVEDLNKNRENSEMDPNNFLGQPNFEGQMRPGPNQMVPNLPQQPMFYPQNQGKLFLHNIFCRNY